jgi:hypothetical protein
VKGGEIIYNNKKKEKNTIIVAGCQGRLDENGGHRDRKNFKKSYHYH